MRTIDKLCCWVALVAGLVAPLISTGCGTPGAPQPPSLNLPEKVADLTAIRAGSQVTLTWTMPKKNTDKLLLKGDLAVRVCRREAAGECLVTGGELHLAPGADGVFTDALPGALAAGEARPLSYFVELRNRFGRSAGLSNAAVVLAGAAPAPVSDLAAEVRKQGVVLRWAKLDVTALGNQNESVVRLRRKLLTALAAKSGQGPLAPQTEAAEENLLVDSCAEDKVRGFCRAVDKKIRFGETYEYRAQRVARVSVDGKTVELAGELSAPVRVEARDIFPPDAPVSLAAVATVGENGAGAAIDLSWQPVVDADLAGYIVYRREGENAWQRINSTEPLVAPAFHDSAVQAGHSYFYAVSSVGQNGHESTRCKEAEETVPNP
ncbi:MAG: fibronectin type III domain-containing protein [Terracidiphilus sp.]|jgi:hypothetical protein